MCGLCRRFVAISIHAPRTGSDSRPASPSCKATNFNPRSPHGERLASFPADIMLANHFNPRSPHGERQSWARGCVSPFAFQSTLPARGATTRLTMAGRGTSHFNPRSPHGERHGRFASLVLSVEFQSTLPARGATARCVYVPLPRDFNPRSPHGERRNARSLSSTRSAYFNPRSPHGERPMPAFGRPASTLISIHAPRTGSDRLPPSRPLPCLRFQSTLPARGATNAVFITSDTTIFQSTLPARGATGKSELGAALALFQSTLPARGATGRGLHQRGRDADFNPRSPHGERLCQVEVLCTPPRISIHAPRTGSDHLSYSTWSRRTHFNPRSPHGERPQRPPVKHWRAYFNPRSPHGERRDDDSCMVGSTQFQSTLPARGATSPAPRSPCPSRGFQSTLPARGATPHRRFQPP